MSAPPRVLPLGTASTALTVTSTVPTALAAVKPQSSSMVKQTSTKFELVGPASEDGSSSCTAWLVRSEHGDLAIFKPQNGEAYDVACSSSDGTDDAIKRKPVRNGIVYGDATVKEVAAYLLDHDHWARVPLTVDTVLWLKGEHQSSPQSPQPVPDLAVPSPSTIPYHEVLEFHSPSTSHHLTSDAALALASPVSNNKSSNALSESGMVPTYGSLQMFVENEGSAEDMGSGCFDVDEVHRIGVLDIRLLNLDRHMGNMLVQRDPHSTDPSKRFHLIPIDHGFILPSYRDLSDIRLEWSSWRQCRQPFSTDTLAYIQALDPVQDAMILKSLGVRDEAAIAMMFSTLLLKEAASQGFTLSDIAQMVQRSSSFLDDEVNAVEADDVTKMQTTLERVIERVCFKLDLLPSSFEGTKPVSSSLSPEEARSESSLYDETQSTHCASASLSSTNLPPFSRDEKNIVWPAHQPASHESVLLTRITTASASEVADVLAHTLRVIDEEIERFRQEKF